MRHVTQSLFILGSLLVGIACGSAEGVIGQDHTSIAAGKTIKNEAQIFAWYDTLASRFAGKQIDVIVNAFAPSYTEINVDKEKLGRAKVVARWQREPAKRGDYDNGPSDVYLSSIVVTGTTAKVKGFWAGSWKAFPDQPENNGGADWQNDFVAEWTKGANGWQITKMDNSGKYRVDLDEAGYAKLKSAHDALKAKYK